MSKLKVKRLSPSIIEGGVAAAPQRKKKKKAAKKLGLDSKAYDGEYEISIAK